MPLEAAWNCNEASGAVLDYSGNSRSLTLSGTTSRVAGHVGTGLGMSSTSERFTGGLAVFGQSLQRTIMCWVRDTAIATDARILEWYDSLTDTSIMRFGLRSQWHVQVSNASTFGRVTINRPTDNADHHLAATYDGATIKLYLDGVLQPTTAFAGPILQNADTFGVIRGLGSGIWADEFRVYSEVLDQATIQSLMNTPVGSAAQTISPTGIPSAEAFGSPTVTATPPAQTVTPVGIPSGEQFGSPTVSTQVTVSPSGISSQEAFGQPTITGGSAGTPIDIEVTIGPTRKREHASVGATRQRWIIKDTRQGIQVGETRKDR